MTEQEKADELWDQMKGFRISHNHRRKCCLVCINQIIKCLSNTISISYWENVRKIVEEKGK